MCVVLNREGKAPRGRARAREEGVVTQAAGYILHPEMDWYSSLVISKQVLRKLILGKISREHQPRFCAVYNIPSKVTSWQQSISACSNLNSTRSIYFLPPFLTVLIKNWVKSSGPSLSILVTEQWLKEHMLLLQRTLGSQYPHLKSHDYCDSSLPLSSGLHGHLHSCAQGCTCVPEHTHKQTHTIENNNINLEEK